MSIEIKDFDFTDAAWDSLYDAVDDAQFVYSDAQVIYDSLKRHLKFYSFGDYLKRYIYLKAELTEPFHKIPLKEYQLIIRCAFSDNHTPPSFSSTTAKLSALSKNWLTQQTVKRNVVFLLGFGLNMGVDDVNMFLTKALREREINPKNPFEVICWYCYYRRYNYLKFEKLWSTYISLPPGPHSNAIICAEQTLGIKKSMYSIHDDTSLFRYLVNLKEREDISTMSLSVKKCFEELYDKSRDLIVAMYNAREKREHEIAVQKYIHDLSRNARLYNYEKQKRISEFRSKRRVFHREDITESDLEHIICAAIPTDRHGNLTPSKASKLNEQFDGKRFSRQRISEIISGHVEATRFDLITLNFFVFSQKVDVYPDPKTRFLEFFSSMNLILETCLLGNVYIQNPYECFILMCILSDDPLGTYADVWELSYHL